MIRFTKFETQIDKELINLLIPILGGLLQTIQWLIQSKHTHGIYHKIRRLLHIIFLDKSPWRKKLLTSIWWIYRSKWAARETISQREFIFSKRSKASIGPPFHHITLLFMMSCSQTFHTFHAIILQFIVRNDFITSWLIIIVVFHF